jgi:hypothetical protein
VAAVNALRAADVSTRVVQAVLNDLGDVIEAGSVDDEPTVLEERLRASLRVCRPGGAA